MLCYDIYISLYEVTTKVGSYGWYMNDRWMPYLEGSLYHIGLYRFEYDTD